MSIADQIIDNNQSEQRVDTDEFGLPLDAKKTLAYIVARIFIRNPKIYLDPENNKLYIGQREVPESQRSAVELADYYNDWCKGGKWPLIFNQVKKFAPRLDRSKLYIADNLLWDCDKYKLVITEHKVKGI
jgi:hypothetical protein